MHGPAPCSIFSGYSFSNNLIYVAGDVRAYDHLNKGIMYLCIYLFIFAFSTYLLEYYVHSVENNKRVCFVCKCVGVILTSAYVQKMVSEVLYKASEVPKKHVSWLMELYPFKNIIVNLI